MRAIAVLLLTAVECHAALFVCDGPVRTVLRDNPCESDEQLAHAYAPREPAPTTRHLRRPQRSQEPPRAPPPPTTPAPEPPASWSSLIERRQHSGSSEELRILRDLQRRQILRDAWGR